MNCPPPPEGCTEYTVSNYCNPTLYICSIPEHLREPRQKRSLQRFRRASDTAATGLDDLNPRRGDCTVLGVPYRTGDLMGIATKFCLECRCGRQNMFCSPRCCFKHANLYENATERIAAERGPRIPDKHPLYHIFK
ncbi:uncharacterized protein CEXT_476081 [Caerostris extrusa]|nr:uncharacterized protein CEXT_476081 [Caerostris extrusa]